MTMTPAAPPASDGKNQAGRGIAKRRRGRLPFVPNRDWEELARCRGVDPDLMSPGDRIGGIEPYDPDTAKLVCHGYGTGSFQDGCPVRRECGLEALRRDEPYGVWGGMTPKTRDRVRRLPESEWERLVVMDEATRRLELKLLLD